MRKINGGRKRHSRKPKEGNYDILQKRMVICLFDKRTRNTFNIRNESQQQQTENPSSKEMWKRFAKRNPKISRETVLVTQLTQKIIRNRTNSQQNEIQNPKTHTKLDAAEKSNSRSESNTHGNRYKGRRREVRVLTGGERDWSDLKRLEVVREGDDCVV